MVDTEIFVDCLLKQINFFAGVPDSLLKDFNACIKEKSGSNSCLTVANEGSAVALAAGHYIATGNIAGVYMQNSGIGNAINPLLSLNDPLVYGIPCLIFIGWRGEPGVYDEPQHLKQGLVTCELLGACGIKYEILPNNIDDSLLVLNKAVEEAYASMCPVAIVVKKGTFSKYSHKASDSLYDLCRERAIEVLLGSINSDCRIVSSTGMISRELYELRIKRGESHSSDFMTVGSMGHASQIALGIALADKHRKIICLEGDGSSLMHLGGFAMIGTSDIDNYIHVVINNSAHDSVGGQETVAGDIHFVKIAEAVGYSAGYSCDSEKSIRETFSMVLAEKGKFFIEIKVAKGARSDLGRPKHTPKECMAMFCENLRGSNR